ncbi:MAG: stage III sporulation protein AC [Clostridia bacterium]|nr:stage III sporulation protein AC [Clostridia bacterium]
MDITLVLKIAGIGFLVSVANIVLNKSGRDEMAMMVSIAGVIIVLIMIISQMADLIDKVRDIFGI